MSYAQVLLFVEIRGRKTIPVIHYVLVSLALILFFSLLTALSEQLGFNAAYLAASVATIVLISLFTALIIKDKKTSWLVFGLLVLLYAFIYVLLTLNDYAFLAGNIGLFLILAIVMGVVGKWSYVGSEAHFRGFLAQAWESLAQSNSIWGAVRKSLCLTLLSINLNTMKKTAGIFSFTGLVILLLFVQCNQGPSRNNKDEEFSFVFMTDIHVKPELRAAEGFAQAIDTINALNPDFVISGGDNVFDALQASYGRADSLYFLYDSLSKRFEMPLYNTIGNHEVFGLYQADGIDPSHEFYGKKMYEERIGDRYYSFDYKHWHFIILDGIGFTPDRKYVGVIDSLQMEWLKADLEAHKDKPVAVSTHIPLLSVGQQIFGKPTSAFSPSEIIINAKEVRELMEHYNVKLVLQGHLHMLEDILYNGIHYVTGGAVCARWWLGPRNGMEEGFLKIDVSGDTFSWQYIDFKWSLTAPQKNAEE